MDDKLVVGIADMKMTKDNGMLVTYALGSCIGICLYDPAIRLAALIHIMLPLNMETGRKSPMKYADTGIRETLREMERRGAVRSRLVAKIAGGARMFDVGGGGSLGNIGQRNIESVHMTPSSKTPKSNITTAEMTLRRLSRASSSYASRNVVATAAR